MLMGLGHDRIMTLGMNYIDRGYVTKEEYDDACQILGTSGGVVKGSGGNKMNEIKPHTNWARKVVNRARAYGVIRDESGHVKLFAVND